MNVNELIKIIFLSYRSRQQITKAILENEFLGNLEENQVEALVSAMYSKQIPPNTLVIQEGDIGKDFFIISLCILIFNFHLFFFLINISGSHLYVSAEGEFDIYEGNKFQRTFGPGVAFGEIALLYNTMRLRSIKGKY